MTWHSHLDDMEIPETKGFIPKGFELVQHWVSRTGLYSGSSQKQGWRSDESALLPPMWPGFKSWRRRHMWVEFVVDSLPCSERFFSRYSGFPLTLKTNTSKFQFNLERTDTSQQVICSKVALGQDKQRKLPFKIMYVFCLSCPSVAVLYHVNGKLQRAYYTPGSKKGARNWSWPITRVSF